uniref:Fucosyltransferase n=1 Tax=Sphaeramia orbicularis TaxID=375764 RepID=A0A673B434_9TELE
MRRAASRLVSRTCSSVCVATVGFVLLLGVCLLYLPDPFSLEPLVSVSDDNSEVTLLIWMHPFGQYRKLPHCGGLYGIEGCTLTDKPRPRAQKWVWMNYESPAHTPGLWRFEGVFNLTMTYRTDSDIFLPYGYLIPRGRRAKGLQNRYARPLHVLSRSLLRPRLVAWVISNWSESQARVAFYYQLRRYLQVDVFGRAGRPLPAGSGNVVRLVSRYQFYLALENSPHTDYITEKLWNAVLAGAVPVVLGPSRQNYERFLPPPGLYPRRRFSNCSSFGRYLLMLKRNPIQLKRHLDWRGSYSVHQPSFWAEHYCTVCRAVKKTRGKATR